MFLVFVPHVDVKSKSPPPAGRIDSSLFDSCESNLFFGGLLKPKSICPDISCSDQKERPHGGRAGFLPCLCRVIHSSMTGTTWRSLHLPPPPPPVQDSLQEQRGRTSVSTTQNNMNSLLLSWFSHTFHIQTSLWLSLFTLPPDKRVTTANPQRLACLMSVRFLDRSKKFSFSHFSALILCCFHVWSTQTNDSQSSARVKMGTNKQKTSYRLQKGEKTVE